MKLGFLHSSISDLHLVMGSSLTVSPANQMPKDTIKKGGKLVIINLQKTPLNNIASLVIHAKVDDVIDLLMSKLGLKIPEWKITRRLLVNLEGDTLTLKAIDIYLYK